MLVVDEGEGGGELNVDDVDEAERGGVSDGLDEVDKRTTLCGRGERQLCDNDSKVISTRERDKRKKWRAYM